MKINILYNLEARKAPPTSPEDQRIQVAIDQLFKPLDRELLKTLPTKNTALTPEAIKVLLQREPSLRIGMEKLSTGTATWEELMALKDMQLNELEVMAMLMRASIDAHLSIFDYLNQVFGTSVTPETKISINGGTMSIRNAIAYNFKKGNLEGDTKEKIGKLKK